MIRPSAVNPKYFFRYIILGVYFGSFLFRFFFLLGSHFYFPCCSLPTSAFIFLILFTYSLICRYCSRFHLWLLICSHFILSYLLTPGTWSTKYTKVIMKSILLAQGFFLNYKAQIFKSLPSCLPTGRSSTSPQNHLNLIIYSSFKFARVPCIS